MEDNFLFYRSIQRNAYSDVLREEDSAALPKILFSDMCCLLFL